MQDDPAEDGKIHISGTNPENTLTNAEREYLERLEKDVLARTADLNENLEKMHATLDSSPDMIQVFKAVRDESGNIVDFIWALNNYRAEQFYGDVIGKRLVENNPGVVESGIFDRFVAVTETGVTQRYELYYEHEQFSGWYYQSAVKFDDGVATSTTDITERKKSEEAISELNKTLSLSNRQLESLNSELNTYNKVVANDYKATIHNLYIYLENIIKTEASRMSDAGKSNLRRAQSAIQKLNLLTEDIIAFSRVGELDQNFSAVSLQKTLVQANSDLQSKIDRTGAEISTEGELPDVHGFPLLLSLLFYHLIDNSLKFKRENESPQITVKSRKVMHRVSENLPEAEFHEICFTDNGIGFPQQEAEAIFEIFYRLHDKKLYRGSGIGLAVCKKIMDMHGGTIRAESSLGNGASFYCYFPVA